MPRRAMTLIETLVVIAIIGVLFGLVLPAIQNARNAATRSACGNNLRQIGLGLLQYHDSNNAFPPGAINQLTSMAPRYVGWQTFLLPYVGEDAVWLQALPLLKNTTSPFRPKPHPGLSQTIKSYLCPLDFRIASKYYIDEFDYEVAFTSFLGVQGQSAARQNGILFADSQIRHFSISDGASNTLLVGERPPSADLVFGWWYAGAGRRLGQSHSATGTGDMVLGVREDLQSLQYFDCPGGEYRFGPGQMTNQCDLFHFWSLHPGGGHFLFADGAVKFLSYRVDHLLPALASRAGGETVSLPD